jgi:hypothetical protein
MKRSEVNRYIEQAKGFLAEHQFHLPQKSHNLLIRKSLLHRPPILSGFGSLYIPVVPV